MQDLRYAGPSIGELSTITGAGEMTAKRGRFFFLHPGPTARLYIQDRPHLLVTACQFLHLADAKLPPKVKRNRPPQGAMERVLTRCADVGFRTWLRDGKSHPHHRIGPGSDSSDGMVRNPRQSSANPRLTTNAGEIYC